MGLDLEDFRWRAVEYSAGARADVFALADEVERLRVIETSVRTVLHNIPPLPEGAKVKRFTNGEWVDITEIVKALQNPHI